MIKTNWEKAAPLGAPDILKSSEAAKYLRVSERTLWSWTRAGKVPCLMQGRILRYSKAKLQALVETNSCEEIIANG